MLIGILITFLSYNPFYQSVSCLGVVFFTTVLNLFIYPYFGAMRVFFHCSEFVFVAQCAILTFLTYVPGHSRIYFSQGLILVNFLQLASAFLCSLWIVGEITRSFICAKNNKVGNDSEVEAVTGGNAENSESLSQIKCEEELSGNVYSYKNNGEDENMEEEESCAGSG
jgi:hypothetical protein